jgi:hypothetical protein
MTTTAPAPHSRWLIRAEVDRLAASRADVVAAISALSAPVQPRRTIRQRIAAVPDWPRTVWLSLLLVATTFFLIWVSIRLVAHLAPLPIFVAAAPGVLLTAAMAGAAHYQVRADHRQEIPGIAGVLRPSLPLAAASGCVVTWLTLWLVLTSGTPTWLAVVFAMILTGATAVAMVTRSSRTSAADLKPAEYASARSKPSLSMRRQHRRARKRLLRHTRRWMSAAHRYAGTIMGTGEPERTLASLISGYDESFSPDSVDPYDLMILTTLWNCHPEPLGASLAAAADKLAEIGKGAGPHAARADQHLPSGKDELIRHPSA